MSLRRGAGTGNVRVREIPLTLTLAVKDWEAAVWSSSS
jgi:hypothetical protein